MSDAPRVRYEVRVPRPSDHRLEVTVVVGGLDGGPFDLVFPSWVPGSYWIQDRVRNVSGMQARPTEGTEPLPVHREEKARWRVAPGGHRSVDVEYTLYGNDPRTALPDVTTDHVFLGGGFAFPYVEGRRSEPLDLLLGVPPGWTIHTELPEVARQPPTYRAADFDELVDSPVDAGHAESGSSSVAGEGTTTSSGSRRTSGGSSRPRSGCSGIRRSPATRSSTT
jgi:predicted metalloprotease with PDZ domain